MDNNKEIYRAALKILDKPEKWIKGRYYANDEHDNGLGTWYKATSCCLFGAIYKAYRENSPGRNNLREAQEICNDLAKKLSIEDLERFEGDLALFNDNVETKYEDVIGLLERGINE